MCVCLCIYFYILLPCSVNFRISWNCLFCFVPLCSECFHLHSLCQLTPLKKSLNIPLYTSEASFIFLFLIFSTSVYQQFTCVCSPFFPQKIFVFANTGDQSLNFPFSHLLWYKQTQEIFSLLLLSLLSVVTHGAPLIS